MISDIMYIRLYRLQEEYHSTEDTSQTDEEEKEEQAEEGVQKERKLIVFKSCPLKLLERCCSCGQEVEVPLL